MKARTIIGGTVLLLALGVGGKKAYDFFKYTGYEHVDAPSLFLPTAGGNAHITAGDSSDKQRIIHLKKRSIPSGYTYHMPPLIWTPQPVSFEQFQQEQARQAVTCFEQTYSHRMMYDEESGAIVALGDDGSILDFDEGNRELEKEIMKRRVQLQYISPEEQKRSWLDYLSRLANQIPPGGVLPTVPRCLPESYVMHFKRRMRSAGNPTLEESQQLTYEEIDSTINYLEELKHLPDSWQKQQKVDDIYSRIVRQFEDLIGGERAAGKREQKSGNPLQRDTIALAKAVAFFEQEGRYDKVAQLVAEWGESRDARYEAVEWLARSVQEYGLPDAAADREEPDPLHPRQAETLETLTKLYCTFKYEPGFTAEIVRVIGNARNPETLGEMHREKLSIAEILAREGRCDIGLH